ncbi:MAG: HDIG domain-containing protein [Clostridiales bacterium]|nr:HDIG domain-containing protein [Clostridiales bacterium]
MKTSRKSIVPVLPILSTVLVILLEFISNGPGMTMVKLGILTLLLTSAVGVYLHIFEKNIAGKKYAISIIIISYLSSIGLLYLVNQPEAYSFWMIGGLLISMLIDHKLGLLLHFNLTFLVGIAFAERMETVLQLLLIGTLMNMLSGYLKKKSTVIYASIIILSTNITLAFVINNFVFDYRAGYNYFSSFFSILTVLIIGFFISLIYQHFVVINEDKRENDDNTADIIDENMEDEEICENTIVEQNLLEEEDKEITKASDGFRTSYQLLNNLNNELLLRLKECSKDLYEHSLLIGDISSSAAKAIQADELLAKAGGLYHEIGKINKGNYIEQGLILAEQYGFPEQLKSILKQHNIKYEKPTSVEAAIVMLSDNVVSTIEYIEKTEDYKYTRNMIIENIFQMRMDKGTFDESGLSIKDYKLLKEFYQKEFYRRESANDI